MPTLDCRDCGAPLDPVRDVVLFHNPDDGFAVYESACTSCGRHDHGARPEVVQHLLSQDTPVQRLARTSRE